MQLARGDVGVGLTRGGKKGILLHDEICQHRKAVRIGSEESVGAYLQDGFEDATAFAGSGFREPGLAGQ